MTPPVGTSPISLPALGTLHRTTYIRQMVNLWTVKGRLWCWLRDELISYDPTICSSQLPTTRVVPRFWLCCLRLSSFVLPLPDPAR